MDPRQIAESFAESMSGLMELLIQENAILARRAFKDLDSLQSKKQQLARSYAEAQGSVESNPDVFATLSTSERDDLRALYKRFRGVLSENMLALRGAHDATDRVIKLIIDTVKEQRGVRSAPAAFGKRATGYAAYSTPLTASIALCTDS